MRGEARIEGHAGHHDAKAIRPDQPHSIFVGGAFGGFRQRSRTMAKPRGDDESACRAALPCVIDETCDRRCRRGNYDEFGDKRQLAEAADRGNAVDFGIMRIHQVQIRL